MFAFGMELPKSLAEELKRMAAEDPTIMRTLGERVVLESGGLDPTIWNGTNPNVTIGQNGPNYRAKPPYDALPTDWNIGVIDKTK